MTGRKLAMRLKEHKADIKYNRQSAAFGRYYSKNQIKEIDYEKARVIWTCTYPHKSMMRKSIEI